MVSKAISKATYMIECGNALRIEVDLNAGLSDLKDAIYLLSEVDSLQVHVILLERELARRQKAAK